MPEKILFDDGDIRIVEREYYGEVVKIFQSKMFGRWYDKAHTSIFVNEVLEEKTASGTASRGKK